MRTNIVVVAFAGVLGICASSPAAAGRPSGEMRESTAAPVALERVSFSLPALRDEAAMVLLGTALIGLAAAVRRSA
jgi:hypothetical protein